MLHFRTAYLLAMRERAPHMFRELRRRGAMDAHLADKAEEARAMFVELTADMDTLPNGVLANSAIEAQATEQVYSMLLEFPN